MDVGKVFPVGDTGSPPASKKLFLVTLLLEAGYPISANQTNFEDSVDLATGKRTWLFLFDGMARRNWSGTALMVKQCADHLAGLATARVRCENLAARAALYAAYDPAAGAIAALESLRGEIDPESFARIEEQHQIVCTAIKNAPKHVIVHRGKSRYWLPAELPESERAGAIDRMIHGKPIKTA